MVQLTRYPHPPIFCVLCQVFIVGATLSICCLATGSVICSATARASFARWRQCVGSLMRDEIYASETAAIAVMNVSARCRRR
jgi:hypothetical protein